MSDPDFVQHMSELIEECQYHVHNATCLKGKDRKDGPPSDTNCGMRIDGKTVPTTTLDVESGEFELRSFHGRLNEFQPLVTCLCLCNNDLSDQGFGEIANAIVMYIGKYATKTSLPMHEGFAALRVAVENFTKLCKFT